MMLIGAGAQARLIVPLTSDKARLREAGRNLAATDAPGRVKEAILLAHAFLKRGSSDRVVVISDAAFSGAEDFMRPAAHLHFVKIEGGVDNVGIVAFEIRRHPDRPAPVEVMVHVKNFTPNGVRVPLTLTLGDKELVRETVEIAANGRSVLIYPFEGMLTGALVARLEIDDAFATDNQAYLAVSDAPTLRLLYVGPGNPFLGRLLRLFPNLELTTVPRWEETGSPARESYDAVIFDRAPVPALVRGNYILIDTIAPNLPLKLQGAIRNPTIAAPATNHPLTEGMSLGDLHVQEALRLATTGAGTVLLRSADHPHSSRGKRPASGAGDRLRSNGLGPAAQSRFPVLLHNTFSGSSPSGSSSPRKACRRGCRSVAFAGAGASLRL
jgi:hypothetical protein